MQGPRSRDKPRLVLMNSAGRHSNWTTATIPSSSKVLGGQGGNGGREKTVWRYRASAWIRHGAGKRQGHSFAFPRGWVRGEGFWEGCGQKG